MSLLKKSLRHCIFIRNYRVLLLFITYRVHHVIFCILQSTFIYYILDLKSGSKAVQEPDSFTFSLPVIRSKLCGSTSSSSNSNQSNNEIDGLSLLLNKVSVSTKENQAPFAPPQAIKGTPQSSSVSTSSKCLSYAYTPLLVSYGFIMNSG